MDDKTGDKPQSPIQRHTEIDITTDAKGGSHSELSHGVNAEYRSPADMMRQMGFDPVKYMTPLQFLVAVLNDDADMVFGRSPDAKKERYKARGIGMSYRVQAAKTAAKYLHMEMPKVEYHSSADQEFGQGLQQAIRKGEHRVRTKRVILETVEEMAPDMPPAPGFISPRI